MKIFWRTFVYNADVDDDRLKRAYLEFGYIDDEPQPRRHEGPFRRQRVPADQERPAGLPGARARAPDVRPHGEHQPGDGTADHPGVHRPEQDAHLPRADVGGGTQDRHVRHRRAGQAARKRLVGNIVDGTAQGQPDTAIVGVANLGNADNLTGHHFSQANLFAFGRQAWDWTLDSEDIARDWVRMTWSNDAPVVDTIVKMMMGSWRSARELSDAAGHRRTSSARATTTARCPSSGPARTTGAPCTTTRPTAPAWALTVRPPAATSSPSTSRPCRSATGTSTRRPENLLVWFHHVPWDRRMNERQDVLGRARLPLPDGRPVRDLDARDVGLAAAVHRRPPLRRGQGQAGHARGRRRATGATRSVNYWKEFSGREIPVDGGPLSAKIVVGGKERRRLQPVCGVVHDPRGRRRVAGDHDGHHGRSGRALRRSSRRRRAFPGRPSSRSPRTTSSGRSSKNYVFNLVPDTTLRSLRVNGSAAAVLQAGRADLQRGPEPRRGDRREGRGRRQRSGRDGHRRAGGDADRAGQGHRHQRRRVVGLHRQPRHHQRGQRRVHRHARLAVADRCGRTTSRWRLAGRVAGDHRRRTATCRAATTPPRTSCCRTSTATGRRTPSSSSRARWPTTTSRAGSSPTTATTTTSSSPGRWAASTQAINKLRVVVIREQNGTATTLQVTGADAQRIVGADGAIWLRLAKAGNTYKAYYSSDGSVYRYMGSTTLNVEATQGRARRLQPRRDLDRPRRRVRLLPDRERGRRGAGGGHRAPAAVGGTVPATLVADARRAGDASARSPRASTGPTRASTTANVISTAGDAALTVADPSATATGRLVNGAFALPSRCRRRRRRRRLRPGRRLGGPTTLLTYAGPVSNDAVTVGFKQPIGATEGAAHGQLQQDADVHPVDDDAVNRGAATGLAPSPLTPRLLTPSISLRSIGRRLHGPGELGDLLVGATVDDEARDLELASGERGDPWPSAAPARVRRWMVRPSRRSCCSAALRCCSAPQASNAAQARSS